MEKAHLMKRFLRKMVNLDLWGGKHTEIINLKKCIPKHLRGEKVTKEAVEELINLGFLWIKTTIFHQSAIGGQGGICCAQEPPRLVES